MFSQLEVGLGNTRKMLKHQNIVPIASAFSLFVIQSPWEKIGWIWTKLRKNLAKLRRNNDKGE